jgi:hypothetical protein
VSLLAATRSRAHRLLCLSSKVEGDQHLTPLQSRLHALVGEQDWAGIYSLGVHGLSPPPIFSSAVNHNDGEAVAAEANGIRSADCVPGGSGGFTRDFNNLSFDKCLFALSKHVESSDMRDPEIGKRARSVLMEILRPESGIYRRLEVSHIEQVGGVGLVMLLKRLHNSASLDVDNCELVSDAANPSYLYTTFFARTFAHWLSALPDPRQRELFLQSFTQSSFLKEVRRRRGQAASEAVTESDIRDQKEFQQRQWKTMRTHCSAALNIMVHLKQIFPDVAGAERSSISLDILYDIQRTHLTNCENIELFRYFNDFLVETRTRG